jgi:uncharacterized protein (DUF1810 family)
MDDLQRFVAAQEGGVYERALAEIRAGDKRGHWMWFIFPQLAGLGSSPTARHYAIRDLDEAVAYLGHPVLGPRLLECAASVISVFPYPDDLKLRSSMTLFARAAATPEPFERVLRQFYDGPDERTIQLLTSPGR